MTNLLLLVHILLFAFSFAFTVGNGILLDRVAATRDAGIIHAAFSRAMPLSIAGGTGWLLTGITGAVLAHLMGYDLAAPWLLVTYALFVVLMAVGIGMHKPWMARVVKASAKGGAEMDAALNASEHKIANAISAFGVLILVWLMVAKPG
jgi:uncharacterized membrane protein